MTVRQYAAFLLTMALILKTGSMSAQSGSTAIDLPTSKRILQPVPGSPQRLNGLPMSMAISPDQRFVVTVNAGYGTFESGYKQSLAVLDTQTGVVEDFPDDRTSIKARQTLYSGLAFSRDGRHVYASMGSETDPLGTEKGDTGSGVVVYGFNAGKISQERMVKIPLQQLAAGRRTMLIGGTAGDKGVPFPAAIAVVGSSGSEKLLVADNLSDDVLLIDAASGAILTRFDLAENDAVPSTYPVALSVSKDETRAFVALWNASEVVELDLKNGLVGRKLALLKPASKTAAGTHPCALELSGDGRTMYVALANRDAVAAVNVDRGQFAVKGYFDTRLPHQTYFGAEPEALALSPDGSRLYVANAITDAIAVLDTRKLSAKVATEGMVEPSGFVPTEWMPMSIGLTGGKLYVATAKGKGTGPNNFPQRQSEGTSATRPGPSSYIATLLYGSLAVLDTKAIERDLPKWTAEVVESNRMKAAEEKIRFAGNQQDRIKHVIYIIKENRTYDQILGDLKQNGKAVGNGDSSLTMYGAEITPNQHKLALQFGVLDNFYDSGEVSGDGHVWSTAGIGTDYLEKTWQQSYRGDERTYDFEGVVAEGYPLLQKIPDVNEPNSGYLWGNLARQGKSYYHFGEYISSTFCDAKKTASPQEGPLLEGAKCQKPSILPGETLPVEWGGGVNKWPWPIPLLATNTATKPELVGHFAVEQPDFNLRIPDQIRVEVFLKHFGRWVADREAGKDDMPHFILLRLPNDHTAGTTPGGPTPKSSIADNDLAVGRAVDAVSHSAFWDDTAFFILEDDAQAGADHVDAHRSLALVVSKYSPRAAGGEAFVDSRFYSTVSVLRTMETLLGLPPMNNNDAFSSMIGSLFTGDGGQAAFSADYRNRDSGLIYTANTKTAPGTKASQRMDFRHADHADTQKLNVILWKDAMGDSPVPALLNARPKKVKNDDD
ncbi:bifunctional YncE family protein/alkaline phosphatase family protein [Tunturiibacter gelidoferens]|uniref:DNA-binding beta-propeller fold protein YncE n=1 Tax=Tunturiibacter gelidiferens TaxID=3069689 RepID=A0ACC5NXC3_9BACT|nr:bifunctional YncE family protein/alkaline phosphatase family protein [Edaphobacter lichenicola]MBB5339193.1 DNA-binding beta-propeller fold protein YncE [Edaphobacter lichenicola]